MDMMLWRGFGNMGNNTLFFVEIATQKAFPENLAHAKKPCGDRIIFFNNARPAVVKD
jgi:hypothetical protein